MPEELAEVADLSVYREQRLQKANRQLYKGFESYFQEIVLTTHFTREEIDVFCEKFGPSRLVELLDTLLKYPRWMTAEEIVICYNYATNPEYISRIAELPDYPRNISIIARLNFAHYRISADGTRRYLEQSPHFDAEDILTIFRHTELGPYELGQYPNFLTPDEIIILNQLGITAKQARNLTTQDLSFIFKKDFSKIKSTPTGIISRVRSKAITAIAVFSPFTFISPPKPPSDR